jgi:hypothetical protein
MQILLRMTKLLVRESTSEVSLNHNDNSKKTKYNLLKHGQWKLVEVLSAAYAVSREQYTNVGKVFKTIVFQIFPMGNYYYYHYHHHHPIPKPLELWLIGQVHNKESAMLWMGRVISLLLCTHAQTHTHTQGFLDNSMTGTAPSILLRSNTTSISLLNI